MLPYSYIFERLPHEIARSSMTDRPFSIGLIRALGKVRVAAFDNDQERDVDGARAGSTVEPDWMGIIASKTDPVDVAIIRGTHDLLIIYPEREKQTAIRHHLAVLGRAAMSFPIDWPTLQSSVVEYQPKPTASSRLWAEGERLLSTLEKELADVGSWIKGDRIDLAVDDDVSVKDGAIDIVYEYEGNGGAHEAVDDDADQWLADAEHRVQVAIEKGRLSPVAAGFAPSRQLPVTVWYDGELWLIDAVLDERRLQMGGRILKIRTEHGQRLLLERGDRWYVIVDE